MTPVTFLWRTWRLLALAVMIPAVTVLAACGTNHGADASAAHSAMANPAVSADAAQLENELLAAWKAHFSPAHPVTSSEAAVAQVFPHGDTGKIASYAVQQLSTAMIGSKPAAVTARSAWAQRVVTYALGPDGTASPASSPSVPGASPVATFSPSPAVSVSS